MLTALLLLVAAPSNDEANKLLTPRMVRYELVYKIAKTGCPLIEKNHLPKTLDTVLGVANGLLKGRAYLTGGEVMMLIEQCDLYTMGLNAR